MNELNKTEAVAAASYGRALCAWMAANDAAFEPRIEAARARVADGRAWTPDELAAVKAADERVREAEAEVARTRTEYGDAVAETARAIEARIWGK